MQELQTKTALITGGSRGLGRNMAIHLAKKGINVVFTYFRNKDKAEQVVREIEATGQKGYAIQLDTANMSQFEGFIEELSALLQKETGNAQLDILINNAGTGLHAPVNAVTEFDFDDMVNIHLKGVFFLTQKILSHLNDGGRIINLSSGLTRFSIPGYSVYAAMKGGVEVYTRYLAKELGARKITANVVAPGAIETDFGGGVVRDNKDVNKMISDTTALGRVGLPDDIGGVVAFLCSDEAGWINGQRIEVSGGMNL